jgi:acyl-coenzyme A thioesterase PaaI-like protein
VSAPVDDGKCFACGGDNPIGLHLHFVPDADGVRAETTLAAHFQGWQNIAHGGIGVTLLDEAMAHAAGAAGYRGVTASMNVRFRNPVPLEQPIRVHGKVAWQRRNVLGVEASVYDASGMLLLHGEGHVVSMGSLDAVDDRRNPASRAR